MSALSGFVLMNEITLPPRLACVASMVRSGSRMADIGTDHAYLPVFLIQKGSVRAAIAADVKEGPLQRARDTVLRYRMQDRISVRLSNGLMQLGPDEADDIVFAGMGGELITALLAACPWVKDAAKHYIFQPMTHSEILRCWLVQNGFLVQTEQTVSEGQKVYLILDAVYTGEHLVRPCSYFYMGDLDYKEPSSRRYLRQQMRYLTNKLHGGYDKQLSAVLEEMKKIDNHTADLSGD